MDWPSRYCSVDKNTFENGAYSIIPIRYKDRNLIMQWRNEQIYHLRQDKPLEREDQETYFKSVVKDLFTEEKPIQYLFSYMNNNECIGYGGLVHINWTDMNAEISFIMDTKLEKNFFSYHWTNYLSLIEQFAFRELVLHKLYVYAFDLRPHLYETLKMNGYFEDARLKEHCLFQEKFMDVVIHSKLNS